MEQEYIPRFLDEKERLLFFSMNELIAFIFVFGIGIAVQLAVFGLIGGAGAVVLTRWLKRKGYLEILVYYLYWYFPPWILVAVRIELKGTPPSAYRMLTG